MKFGQLFLRSLTRFNTTTLFAKKQITSKVALTTVGLGFATWFSTNKYFAEELTVLETDDNLLEGEVRELLVGPKPEDTILVINYQGSIYSIQSKCSHFGFSLAKGLLIGDEIICPLHNSGFSIETGESNQGPSFNGLKTFPVERVDGKIKVSIPKQGWGSIPDYK
jgi:nitrite reductase/ring-hydroxylating ferredoxin subunit